MVHFYVLRSKVIKAKNSKRDNSVSWPLQISTNVETNQSQVWGLMPHTTEPTVTPVESGVLEIFLKMTTIIRSSDRPLDIRGFSAKMTSCMT